MILEYPTTITLFGGKRRISLDILAFDPSEDTYYPIELKYKTKSIKCNNTLNSAWPVCKLKTHSAQNINRYLFWRDVARIEAVLNILNSSTGFVVMLTNDDEYWKLPSATYVTTEDALFRIHVGSMVSRVQWMGTATPPAMPPSGRFIGNVFYQNFTLRKQYAIPEWLHYSLLTGCGNKNSEFKFLTLEI